MASVTTGSSNRSWRALLSRLVDSHMPKSTQPAAAPRAAEQIREGASGQEDEHGENHIENRVGQHGNDDAHDECCDLNGRKVSVD